MLTPRDRSALTLALELLRDSRWSGKSRDSAAANRVRNAKVVIEWGLAAVTPLVDAIVYCGRAPYEPRLLRVRLALLLRALLRADRGDYGPRTWQCSRGLHRVMVWVNYDRATCLDCKTADGMHKAWRGITPMWQVPQ